MARLLTDYTMLAYFTDVYMVPEYQERGWVSGDAVRQGTHGQDAGFRR